MVQHEPHGRRVRGDTLPVMTQRTSTESSKHICIVLLTGLGDVVHGLPLVNAIRDRYPSARITWIVEATPGAILAGHPSIDRMLVYHRKDGWRGVMQLRRDLREIHPIDLTLNLNVYFKSVWPTLLSRAPRRIGFNRARTFDGVWLASNEWIAARPRAHTADMTLEFADHLGIPVPNPEWRLSFSEDERAGQARFFERFEGRPVATIVPASATIKKDWLPERWSRVADALETDFGMKVVIAGGPGEREQAAGREVMAKSAARIEWAMGDSVRRLAWIVDKSNLLLAPDTGPIHIARALGVPVVSLFAHTNPWRVGPWRAFEDLWVDHYTDAGAAPNATDRQPKWDRMPTITVDEVLQRVQLAADKYSVTRPHGGVISSSHADLG